MIFPQHTCWTDLNENRQKSKNYPRIIFLMVCLIHPPHPSISHFVPVSFLLRRMAQGRFIEEPLSPSPQQPTVREQHLEQPPTVRERQLEAEVQRLRAAAATGAGQSASSALSPSRPVSLRGPSFTYLLPYEPTISAQNMSDTRLLSGLYCCVLVEILSSESERRSETKNEE